MRAREAYSYGCLMVRLPKPLADKVLAFGATIPDGRLAADGREEIPHITLKYGITTFDPDDVEAAVEGTEPFEVTLGRCGAFLKEDCVVLKIGVQSQGLFSLNNKVNAALYHEDQYLVYKPHVTVAYIAKDRMNPYYWQQWCVDDFQGEKFGVDSLDFTTPGDNRYVISLNGKRSALARRTASAERVAGMVLARLDVRISPMGHKFELSDGRQEARLVGRPADVDRAVKKMKWDESKITRMGLEEAMKFVDAKLGRSGLKWDVGRAKK